jgi:aerobic carbon-monoxide dehydrogenase medium subunit
MKPSPFAYHRPSTVGEAAQLLADHADDDARILAGGQSLGAVMAFRLSRPGCLIDINEVEGLDRIWIEDRKLVIGATARHARFHEPVEPGPLGHLLATVVRSIAHYPIRTRGTFCGSLAHFDPASEWCLVAATLDAEMHAESMDGRRVLRAADYFQSAMVTALRSDELLIEARLPLLPAGTRFGFMEFSRRKGDFAIAAALACYRLEDGLIRQTRIGVGGAEELPRRIPEAEALLDGGKPSETAFDAAAQAAAAAVNPLVDPQISESYRRSLVRTMTFRALMQTFDGTAP